MIEAYDVTAVVTWENSISSTLYKGELVNQSVQMIGSADRHFVSAETDHAPPNFSFKI